MGRLAAIPVRWDSIEGNIAVRGAAFMPGTAPERNVVIAS